MIDDLRAMDFNTIAIPRSIWPPKNFRMMMIVNSRPVKESGRQTADWDVQSSLENMTSVFRQTAIRPEAIPVMVATNNMYWTRCTRTRICLLTKLYMNLTGFMNAVGTRFVKNPDIILAKLQRSRSRQLLQLIGICCTRNRGSHCWLIHQPR